MMRGDVPKGICWMLGTFLGYVFLIIPGFVVHILCILDAGKKDE